MNKFCKLLKKIRCPYLKCVRSNIHSAIYSRMLRDLPKTQCSVLCSGLTVATEERCCNNVCMGFYIDAGSRHENETLNGVTHFFEHIAFKGTNKRSKTALESDISKSASKFKCFTTRDTSVYYVECLSAEKNIAAAILFDCIFNNAFIDSEIEIQKYLVYNEMIEYDKTSVNVLYDYLHSSAFQGTQLGQTVMGPSYNLYNFKADSISNYIKNIFAADRAVFVAVGDIKHSVAINIAEQCFSKNSPECRSCQNTIRLGPTRYTGSQTMYRDDSMNMAHIAIAVEGPSFSDYNKIKMELASAVLGGWDKSQPSGTNHGTKIAHNASAGKLCESYKAFGFYYQDVGLWGVEFISLKEDVDDMLLAVQKEWMGLCYLITDGELRRAKNEMITKMIRKHNSKVGAFHDIGSNVLRTGNRHDLNEIIGIIDGITANDVQNACNKYIYDRCPVVAGIGTTENLLSYPRIRSYMYWLRV